MKIQLIGTGAADWNWTLPLAPGVRGSTVTLLDGRILIDAGTTAVYRMRQQGIDLGGVTDILITHSHVDHFDPGQIKIIAAAPRREKLRVWSTPQALGQLGGDVDKIPLEFGKTVAVGGLEVTPLPANHMLPDANEHAHHFLIDTPEGKRLFYALDGGWMVSATRWQLAHDHIDMIIWDATSGNSFNDWRFADHNDLGMIRCMRVGMAALGLIDDDTIHCFDHIARTLWPESAEARAQLAREFDGILAEDGMTVEL